MAIILYLSHPQVAVDPAIPVPDWSLSAVGRARTLAFAQQPGLSAIGRIVSSTERKAIETATLIGEAIGLVVDARPDLHENDRSATGFLRPDEFEQVANRFFAKPEESVRGWERAIDAQARITRAVAATLAEAPEILLTLFVGHGAVGTLLMTAMAGLPIDRRHDQPAGGGNWFVFGNPPPARIGPWQPMETDPGAALATAGV